MEFVQSWPSPGRMVRVPGRGLLQIFSRLVWHAMKKWTQSDVRVCKNEGSKRSNNSETGGQQDRKSRRKLLQNTLK